MGSGGQPQGAEAVKPKVLDLFSGLGGFTIAFDAAGFQTIAFSEIEPFPCALLAQNFPMIPNLGSIKEIDAKPYRGTVDVVCGGFPCQPHSHAGMQLAEADPRDLWPEMARIVSECLPRFILAENVPGLSDEFLDRVCADLESLGYSVLPIEVPALAAGAPQVSNRLWIMAQANGFNVERLAFQSQHERPLCQADDKPLHDVWLSPPPDASRVDHGIPNWNQRVKAVGNSIVPAVAYYFAAWIYSQLRPACP